MPHAFHLPAQMAELLGDDSLSLEELARACRRAPEWVGNAGQTLRARSRRVADLEASFDADPHLAALTVDLMEEVAELRHQLRQLRTPVPGS